MIDVQSLARHFGAIKAVDDISFKVNKGEILGFLGPNGAGKSTTMKMITTFLAPTSGTATVGGFDIIEDPLKVRSLVGYLPESAASYQDMNVFDFLKFVATIRGFDGEEKLKKIDRVMDICNLKEVGYQPIETLSKGYRQRVGFAQAFLHDPDYLILDEPTEGLDPNQKQEVRKLIKETGKEKCIILSTHILEEVEAVCSRAIIIGNGKIVADSTPQELKSRSGVHGAVTITLQDIDVKDALESFEKIQNVARVEQLKDNEPLNNQELEEEIEAGKDSESEAESGNEEKAKARSSKKEAKHSLTTFRLYPMSGKSISHATATFVHDKKWEVDGFTVESGDLNEVFYNLTKGGGQQ
ncbi:MAG: ABC transporter ATP-binding protein [Candidatus Rifleibacteriota bacterium]